MSKVLVSFLGTSLYNREYRKANYKFDDDNVISTSFIAAAIKERYNIDKLILIGTVKSMWEEVYRTFSKEHIDENFYFTLSEHCQHANSKSELYLPDISKIEKYLGEKSKIILIKYGLNENEIAFNQEIILGIEQYLNRNDELIVDITHSFRSLPLFLLNTLIYLQNVSRKNIVISRILYGMLDVTTEMGYTPVVDLKLLLETNDWISGAYSFKEFGDSYKIAELLKDNHKSICNKLKRFSDAKNLNYFNALEKQVQELQSFKGEKNLPAIAQIIINPIVDEFINQMSPTNIHYLFQFKLAKWHFQKMNYSSSYICFTEAIISYVCMSLKLDEKDKDNRDKAKEFIFKDRKFIDIRSIYNRVNSVRKQLAHNVVGEKSITDMIRNLEIEITNFENVINK